jgi:hypothetical protein
LGGLRLVQALMERIDFRGMLDHAGLPKSGGKTLLPVYDAFVRYLNSAFNTNMDLSAELIWETYSKRADVENQINGLKYECGMEGFLFRIVGCHRTRVTMGDGGLQPDEHLQAEGHGWKIIAESGYCEVQMHSIKKLHHAQWPCHHPENHSQGQKTGLYR